MRWLLVVLAGCWTAAPPPTVNPAPPDVVKQVVVQAKLRGKQIAAELITVEQLRAITGYAGGLEEHGATEPTSTYDDIHFKATGQPERFDFMLRVWTLDGAALHRRFEEIQRELPASKPTKAVGDRALTAFENNLYGVAWLDNRGALVLLSCGNGQCASIDVLIAIAKGVSTRLR